MRCDDLQLVGKMFRTIGSDSGPVWQIWVSGPVRSGNLYAQSGRALFQNKWNIEKEDIIS